MSSYQKRQALEFTAQVPDFIKQMNRPKEPTIKDKETYMALEDSVDQPDEQPQVELAMGVSRMEADSFLGIKDASELKELKIKQTATRPKKKVAKKTLSKSQVK